MKNNLFNIFFSFPNDLFHNFVKRSDYIEKALNAIISYHTTVYQYNTTVLLTIPNENNALLM